MLKHISEWRGVILIVLFFHLVLLLFTKFTAWPEMTFWPYLILKGWLPYQDIAIVHTPVLLADLTIFYKIFGLGLIQLKIYTWILILSTDVLLFWVTRRLWDKKIAFLSLLVYIPIQIFFGGNGLWFDLALAPLALAIYYNIRKRSYIWAGLWWGIAAFTKQTAFWLLIPIVFIIVRRALKEPPLKRIKPIGKLALGAGLMFLISFITLSLLGIWGDFWLWAVRFGVTKLPASAGQIHLPTIRQFVIASFPFLILTFSTLRLKKSHTLITWAIFASLGTFPRWEMFHIQPGLPFLAIGLGAVLSRFSKFKQSEKIALTLGLTLFAIVITRQGVRDFGGKTRFFEPEVLKVAAYIKQNTRSGDAIYVANAWDSLYVLSDTIPATRPWLPYLAWYMEIPGIQDLVVASMTIKPPKLIVQGQYQNSGLGAYRPAQINTFITENYKLTVNVEGYDIWSPK